MKQTELDEQFYGSNHYKKCGIWWHLKLSRSHQSIPLSSVAGLNCQRACSLSTSVVWCGILSGCEEGKHLITRLIQHPGYSIGLLGYVDVWIFYPLWQECLLDPGHTRFSAMSYTIRHDIFTCCMWLWEVVMLHRWAGLGTTNAILG